jgi:hypothetical protein
MSYGLNPLSNQVEPSVEELLQTAPLDNTIKQEQGLEPQTAPKLRDPLAQNIDSSNETVASV